MTEFTPLPREFKAKWLEALRSGKFPQGFMALRSQTGYCCLGVACVVAGVPENTLYGWFIPHQAFGIAPEISDALDTAIDTLTSMNDIKRMSFKEIADWIEAYL